MNFRSPLAAIVVALAVAAPMPVLAQPFHVENHTAAWVTFNVSPKPVPPSARCLAPGAVVTEPNAAGYITGVYVIAHSGGSCASGRSWESGVETGGHGAVVAIGQTASAVTSNSSGIVRIENRSTQWAEVLVHLTPSASQTTWCMNPGSAITTQDMVHNAAGYVIVSEHANCAWPRAYEHQADGHHIVVSGNPGSYTINGR